MRLCFGTFASVLNQCRCTTILQAPLIARIAAVVDPCSRYIGENRFKIQKQIQECGQIHDNEDITGDAPMSNKLLKCKQNFIFTERENKNIPTQYEITNRIENIVAPFIDEDKKPIVILALLHIIQQDESIDFEKKENFKKYLGKSKQDLLQQNDFIFSDFLGKILLYTVCGVVDNTVGKEYIQKITNSSFINDITKNYMYEFQWNTNTQTLVLSPFIKMFNTFYQALEDRKIITFLEKIDPTNMMDICYVEYCEEFINFIKNNFFQENSYEQKGLTSEKICEFCKTLDNYIEYLGHHMRSQIYYTNNNDPNIFVPINRYENQEKFIKFYNQVQDYRKQLATIFQELSYHIHLQ